MAPADQLDAAGGGEVQEVHPDAGQSHQFDVAVDHQLLGDRRPARQPEAAAARSLVHHRTRGEPGDLAVLGERDPEAVGVLERPAHEERVLHAVAVVGEDPHAGRGQFGERRQLRPGRPTVIDRRGRTSQSPARSPCRGTKSTTSTQSCVGIGVRHRHDRSEAAERRRTAAGLDRLGLLAAGFAEVACEVDEAGAHDQPVGGDHLVAFTGVERAPTSSTRPSLTRTSTRRSPLRSRSGRRRSGCSCGQSFASSSAVATVLPEPSRSNSTAMRTAMPFVTCWVITRRAVRRDRP